MKEEIELFKKCCFCIPLRYGLLGWGYFKLIADAVILAWTARIMYYIVVPLIGLLDEVIDEALIRVYTAIIFSFLTVLVFIADIIVTVMFIIGGHKKNPKLMTVFFYMSIVIWAHTVITIILHIIELAQYFFIFHLLELIAHFISLALQTYIIFLVRNEIIKLQNANRTRYNAGYNAVPLQSGTKFGNIGRQETEPL